jgi:endonuclease/exonuclease/phosphatase (EEP) superfamily protein YafD
MKQEKQSTKKAMTVLRNTLTAIVIFVNIAAAAFLMLTAWAGYKNPVEWPLMGVAPMLTPVAIVTMLIVFVVDLIAWRRTAIFAALVILITLPASLDVIPLHVFSHRLTPEEQERSWTLLSMNVTEFTDMTGEYPDSINPTLSYIIRTDADVVCLQETENFSPEHKRCITQAQIDSLTTRYPYVFINDYLMILSKFKTEPIYLDFDEGSYGSGDLNAYRLHIDNKPVTIFNLHLRSYHLSATDKGVLHGLRHVDSIKVNEVRYSVLPKLEEAAVDRARQANRLVEYIKHYGGTNAIVCGDFNDVPGCYTMRQLADQHFTDAYAKHAFGYQNTFNEYRFYFCIDHIMWRGDMNVTSYSRDKISYSDHYPIRATFTWVKKQE